MTERLPILHFKDRQLVVVEKPSAMLSVPGRGPLKQDCLARRLQQQIPEMIDQPAVHRLDMFTTGLMVYAITKEAHRQLSKQFAERVVEKEYTAVVERVLEQSSGEIRLPLRLDPDNRPRQIYDPIHGKLGITRWQKLEDKGVTSRLLFFPETGRTHQLRVHAAHPLGLDAAIVGDSLYGSGKEGERMLLHASRLKFYHPETGAAMSFSSQPAF